MNLQLLQKIIKLNNPSVPEFCYDNPFLDKNVAQALAKSVVKVLTTKDSSNVNNKLRACILENVRKLCQYEPNGHIKVNENLLVHILHYYEKSNPTTSDSDMCERNLEAFLIRNMKNLSINSKHHSINPEIVQGLMNLDNKHVSDVLLKNIIHLDENDKKCSVLLTNVWNQIELIDPKLINDLSFKLKSVIEQEIIDICCDVIKLNENEIIEKVSFDKCFKRIVSRSSKSSCCFQICCSILNTIFIKSHFDSRLKVLINIFIGDVKSITSKEQLVILYPKCLQSLVLLLHCDLEILSLQCKHKLLTPTICLLDTLRNESHKNFLMLLSHYPVWYDLYVST